jgi:hypothetical protein
VKQETLLAEADTEAIHLSDLFKDHPAWCTLIVPDGQGGFRFRPD